MHALLGENGAGKSTLIKVVTGAHQPDCGTIAINGQIVEKLSPSLAHGLGIACIYQQPALFPDLTVAENIGLRLRKEQKPLRPVAWARRDRNALRNFCNALAPTFRQIAKYARLRCPSSSWWKSPARWALRARIVIMDVPTASLTQKEQHLLYAVVRDLRKAGVGVDLYFAPARGNFALADRVTVLRDGESVGTAPGGFDINETDSIRMMVGREVSQIYPPSESAPGEVVLELKNVRLQQFRGSCAT